MARRRTSRTQYRILRPPRSTGGVIRLSRRSSLYLTPSSPRMPSSEVVDERTAKQGGAGELGTLVVGDAGREEVGEDEEDQLRKALED